MTKVDNILNAYANDRLTREECLAEDFSAEQCEVLENALGWGTKGIITPEEKTELEQADFAKDFIQDLAGIDGKKALQTRVRWLGDHINTKWLLDYNLSERRCMFQELRNMGDDAKEAVPALIDALNSKDEDLHWDAAYTLSEIGPEAKDAVPILIDALKAKSKSLVYISIVALGNFGPDAKEAVPALIDNLNEDNIEMFNLRIAAAMALGQIGPASKVAIPTLIDMLKDQRDMVVRYTAAEALGNIGGTAFFAIPVLQQMAMNDRNYRCRQVAQEALDKMMGEIR